MFPGRAIRAITNGVHAGTWAAPPIAELFDRRLPDWRRDAFSLRHAVGIPPAEVASARAACKLALVEQVNRLDGTSFDADVLTLGFARRATAYKRAALLFRDLDRLREIAQRVGPLQIVYAGKAHPRDEEGKQGIREVFRAHEALDGEISVIYLPDYDMELGRLLCSGCDVWLNTPVPGLEASGTSGMKAALNGVPSLSILDGWWLEGCVEGVTGWAIGADGDGDGLPPAERDRLHAEALYAKLGDVVAPCYYREPEAFAAIGRQTISLNGSFFNTQRMVLEYLHEAYLDPATDPGGR
jgi:starch phosphorylase